jgi:hypothetical protein
VDSAFSLPALFTGSFQAVISEIEEIPRRVEGKETLVQRAAVPALSELEICLKEVPNQCTEPSANKTACLPKGRTASKNVLRKLNLIKKLRPGLPIFTQGGEAVIAKITRQICLVRASEFDQQARKSFSRLPPANQ